MRHIISASPVAAAIEQRQREALRQRFTEIKAFYAAREARILAEPAEWGIDPYAWEDCRAIELTPIEQALWHDIRAVDIVVYPQYPVGRFFVDFGNPAAKVAIECDGMRWHTDAAKDAARDEELKALGWTVYRIKGRDCFTDTKELRDDDGLIQVSRGFAHSFVEDIAMRHPIGRNRADVDLDAIKAAGRNGLEASKRILAAHAAREHAEVLAHFQRPEMP